MTEYRQKAFQGIATCAVSQLIAPKIENTDHLLTGPDAILYEQVAATMSKHLGHVVTHQRLSVEELGKRYEGSDLQKDYAEGLANMDISIAGGPEDRTGDAVERLMGFAPTPMEKFVERNLPVWQTD